MLEQIFATSDDTSIMIDGHLPKVGILPDAKNATGFFTKFWDKFGQQKDGEIYVQIFDTSQYPTIRIKTLKGRSSMATDVNDHLYNALVATLRKSIAIATQPIRLDCSQLSNAAFVINWPPDIYHAISARLIEFKGLDSDTLEIINLNASDYSDPIHAKYNSENVNSNLPMIHPTSKLARESRHSSQVAWAKQHLRANNQPSINNRSK